MSWVKNVRNVVVEDGGDCHNKHAVESDALLYYTVLL